MSEQRERIGPGKLSVLASNFGPIARAKIDLRPLTVFVGPSNTGKSWLSILLYALHGFGSSAGGFACSTFPRLREEIREAAHRKGSPQSLPDRIGRILRSQKQIDCLAREFADDAERLCEELRRCYGLSDPAALASRESATGGCSILVRENSSTLLHVAVKRRGFSVKPAAVGVLKRKVDAAFRQIEGRIQGLLESNSRSVGIDLVCEEFLQSLHWHRYGMLRNRAWYLPADRAGIMRTQAVVIGSLIAGASLEGIRRSPRTPLLSGVLADFLEELIVLDKSGSRLRRDLRFPDGRTRTSGKKRSELAEQVEQRILGGRIVVNQSKITRHPRLDYRPHSWKESLSMTHASSMV